jgi:hypothetical protein
MWAQTITGVGLWHSTMNHFPNHCFLSTKATHFIWRGVWDNVWGEPNDLAESRWSRLLWGLTFVLAILFNFLELSLTAGIIFWHQLTLNIQCVAIDAGTNSHHPAFTLVFGMHSWYCRALRRHCGALTRHCGELTRRRREFKVKVPRRRLDIKVILGCEHS